MRLSALVAAAIDEDLGHGDVTTEPTIGPEVAGTGRVLAKQALVVAGHEVARAVFAEVDARLGGSVTYDVLVPEGTGVEAGTVVATVAGPLRNVVIGERTALNFLMRMCGIATNTRRFVDAAGPDGPRVVDTRKTTPLHRDLEKHAVRCGGGFNHRHALFDGVLVKDNHVDAVGSLTEAVRRARAANHHLIRVEVEVRSLVELEEALGTAADAFLLDNMDDATLREAVRIARERKPSVVLEASGNMSIERTERIRGFGLDLVSVGGLIHQATWADLSLKIRRG
ncbi:MAG: carboxylating nicotinate-nucleotide diphosphorylase [Alphaproteobacteria bacterium]|nr:carboxylating nicotinate-nucleotide diphosphorylase [Alphaproteobacteria bacterium]